MLTLISFEFANILFAIPSIFPAVPFILAAVPSIFSAIKLSARMPSFILIEIAIIVAIQAFLILFPIGKIVSFRLDRKTWKD